MKIVTSLINNKDVLIIALAILILLTIGLATKVNLGDEIHHFRHAEVVFNSDERPIIDPDPIYQRSEKVQVGYPEAVLWHSTLAILWKITGGVSFGLAQIYHCLFLVILVFSVYLLSEELFSKEVGVKSAFVLISTPMVVVFSVLFYMEIPVLAFSTLSIALIAKRKYFLAGIAFGLAMLTKINAILFLPGILLFLFCYSDKKWKTRLVNILLFCLIVFFVNLPDGLFRHKTWGYYYMPAKKTISIGLATFSANSPKKDISKANGSLEKNSPVEKNKSKSGIYSPSSLYNPRDLVSYFGIVLLILLLLYIILKKYQKNDLLLWMTIGSYAILYFYFFVFRIAPTLPDIRYLMPILPFVTILGAKTLASLPRRIKMLVLVLCVLQFITTSGFIYSKRYIPKDLEQGFSYIRNNLPKDSLSLYPEVNVRYYSKRRSIWTEVKPSVRELLWFEDKTILSKILSSNTINYVVVKKSRIYNSPKEGFTGGYPKSFVDRLPTFSFLKPIFDNSEMSIWQVDEIKGTVEASASVK